MIPMADEIIIEGKIVEIRDSAKKITRTYTYGYISLRIQVKFEYYSVFINSSQLNKYGFLPKVGQCIRVKGRLFLSEDGF